VGAPRACPKSTAAVVRIFGQYAPHGQCHQAGRHHRGLKPYAGRTRCQRYLEVVTQVIPAPRCGINRQSTLTRAARLRRC
jgi:hypothetical protein